MNAAGATYDIVIRGGLIVDGLGGEPFEGDVAVQGGFIAAVGTVAGTGAREIDATGLLVTPGFVDLHTHYDGQAIWSDRMTPSSAHGVTTAVMGNCGVGFAPCRPDDHDVLVDVMAGVEDIPGVVMVDGLPWTWETFPNSWTPSTQDAATLIWPRSCHTRRCGCTSWAGAASTASPPPPRTWP